MLDIACSVRYYIANTTVGDHCAIKHSQIGTLQIYDDKALFLVKVLSKKLMVIHFAS
jgi:hypothetical protein